MNPELYRIIENGFRLGDTDKMKLLGALQKLEQYEKNPIANMQPCWKYVKKNSLMQQLEHLRREIMEVEKAQGLDELALESFDCLQIALTAMYILAVKFNVDLSAVVKLGIEKNHKRGYYDRE